MRLPLVPANYRSLGDLAGYLRGFAAAIAAGWNQQHTASGAHGTITLTGTATATKQPRASAYHSTTQSIPDATWTALTFDSEDFDTAQLHHPAVNTDRATIPTAGIYLVTARATFAGNTTGSRGIGITKNGTTTTELQKVRATTGVNPGAFGFHNEQVTALLELRAGDYVAAIVFQDSGGALNVGSTSRFHANELVVAKLW